MSWCKEGDNPVSVGILAKYNELKFTYSDCLSFEFCVIMIFCSFGIESFLKEGPCP
jgi:hypothetical protein